MVSPKPSNDVEFYFFGFDGKILTREEYEKRRAEAEEQDKLQREADAELGR